MESNITYVDADEAYRALRSRYVWELRRHRREGLMTFREYSDWELNSLLDATKFPIIADLWKKMDELWPKTKKGMKELEATAGDTVLAPIVESVEAASPLDDALLAMLPKFIGKTHVSQFAAVLNADAQQILASFRRVRAKLEGFRAYECLCDGQLGIEVVTDEQQ
jgi:hypothetical protein